MRREVELDRITQQHLKLLLGRGTHHTLGDLAGHTGVQFHGDQLLGLLENAHADVTGSGTDLEDGVGRLEVGLFDDGICYTGILENMLTKVGVELEDIILGWGCCAGAVFLGGAVVGRGRGCAFALGGCFTHVDFPIRGEVCVLIW